jgi:cysteine desulfurase/selenocysteine lyase
MDLTSPAVDQKSPRISPEMTDSATIAATRARLRAEMPVTRKWAYLDHAAVSPLTRPARDVMARWIQETADEGDVVWPNWAHIVHEARKTGARLIGADPDEITLVNSTTQGINLVADGIAWKSGDNVVTLDDEFPSNLYPWMQQGDRGVETRFVPTRDGRVDYHELAACCDERTRVITVSWVGYANGCRRDLKTLGEIAARRGAYLFVDAIQALGPFPLNVNETPIDFLAADSHKWMLGPEGAGIAYIRRDRLAELRPIGIGAHSVVQGSNYTHIELKLRNNASRYEGGAKNMGGLAGMGASLALFEELGPANLAASVLDITDYACRRLGELGYRVVSPRDNGQASGIVSFEVPGVDLAELRKHCLAQGVALAFRAGRLRISPHAYNNEDDIERFLAALKSFK